MLHVDVDPIRDMPNAIVMWQYKKNFRTRMHIALSIFVQPFGGLNDLLHSLNIEHMIIKLLQDVFNEMPLPSNHC